MTKIVNSTKLFELNIKTLYGIESCLFDILPDMIEVSIDERLKKDLEIIYKETAIHKDRIEKIFDLIDMKPVKHFNFAVHGMIDDIKHIIKNETNGPIKDVLLANQIMSFEYYEMANYMTAKQEAKNLGLNKAVDLLEKTIEEEVKSEKEFNSVINHDLKFVADEEVVD